MRTQKLIWDLVDNTKDNKWGKGANLYVCGNAKTLAPSVHEALLEIAQSQGCLSREVAETYLKELQEQHRYQLDVF